MRVPSLVALALVAVLAGAGNAPARTVWLCKPGANDNPCESSLTATRLAPDGRPLGTERIGVAGRRAAVDCFYVYPTVSEQPTVNANRRVDAQLRGVASFQASRLSQACRVWAPVYRQLTLATIADPSRATEAASDLAYRDVRSAWRDYLRNHSRGRRFVFVGHSQGTFMLRRLIAAEVDRRPSVRRRMLSAILVGGNVTVAKGRTTGGDFRRIRACRSARQTGCVVAYSTYAEPPPADSLFGRVSAEQAERTEVLCTNPASLDAGGRGLLDGYVRSEPFPGVTGDQAARLIGPLPAVATPWIKFPGHYAAQCVNENGASVLRIEPVSGARTPTPVPDARWGLHLADINIALGDLSTLVLRQIAAATRR